MTSKPSFTYKVSYTYHPVGQGLFVSGKLQFWPNSGGGNKGGEFNFVYDCGSRPKTRMEETRMKKLINDYTSSLPNIGDNGMRKLDLLIISHFHYDHISGLDHLLNQVKVDTVIMPYLLPSEVLLYVAANSEEANADSNYLEFLLNPYGYLLKKRERGEVEKIIVIGRGSNNDEYIEDNFTLPDGPVDFNPESLFDITTLGSKEWDGVVENRLREDGLVDMNDIGSKVIPKSHHGYASSFKSWLFRFFNAKNSIDNFDKKIQTFEGCLTKICGKSSIEEILRDKETLKEGLKGEEKNGFKKCYEEAFGEGKLNLTSLVLYNQILDKETSLKSFARPYIYQYTYPYICMYEEERWYKELVRRYSNWCISHLGHFLTGDSNLRNKQVFKEFSQHYKNTLSESFIFQLPHHGSKKNWNSKLLCKLPNNIFYIASAGISNIYKHPDQEVLDIIRGGGRIPVIVNEECGFMYEYTAKKL